MKWIFSGFLMCFLMAASYASQGTASAVVVLQYRTPDEVLPTVTPFLDKTGIIKGFENKILIQSTPDNLELLQKMIHEVDVALPQLLITVSYGRDKPAENTQALGEKGGGYTISTTRESSRQIASLRVESGQVAFLSAGVAVPLTQSIDASHGSYRGTGKNRDDVAYGNEYARDIDYQTLKNGIYVRPNLLNQQVKLELLIQNDQPASTLGSTRSPAYTTFQTSSTVMVPLNTWVYLGGNQNREADRTGYSYRTTNQAEGKKDLWLRIEKAQDGFSGSQLGN